MGRTACTKPHCVYKGALYLFFSLKVVNLGLSPGLTNIKYTHEIFNTLKETNRNAEPTSKTSVKNRNDKTNEPSKDHIEYKIVD